MSIFFRTASNRRPVKYIYLADVFWHLLIFCNKYVDKQYYITYNIIIIKILKIK